MKEKEKKMANTFTVETNYKNVLVFTHNDADGILAGYIVKHKFDNNLADSNWSCNVKVYCCSYGKQFNLSWFKNKTEEYVQENGDESIEVFMLDYSIEPNEQMIEFKNWLEDNGHKFFWIDHHITAIEKCKHFNIDGLQENSQSGCANTWKFLYGDEKMPKIVKMISDYDIFNKKSEFSFENELYPIMYYISSLGTNLNENEGLLVSKLSDLFNDESETQENMKNCLNIGLVIKRYVENQNMQNIKKIYEMEWNDYHCLVLNTTNPGSKQFEKHPEYDNADICITWSFDGKEYFYSMYSKNPKIHCGDLCKQFLSSGGGHKSAAGGRSKKMILDE